MRREAPARGLTGERTLTPSPTLRSPSGGPLRVEHTTARPVPERGRLLRNPLRFLGASLKGEEREEWSGAKTSVVSGGKPSGAYTWTRKSYRSCKLAHRFSVNGLGHIVRRFAAKGGMSDRWAAAIRTERHRGDASQMGSERDHEISQVARKAKDMRRVVFWRSKAFGATGPAHRGRVPDSSVVEQLSAKQSAGVRIILWKKESLVRS